MRGIAPCGSCHGSLDNKTGSPWLEGQSEAYMKAQLQAFASGERRNDISQQMRNIARAMTPQEIDAGRGVLRLAAAGCGEGGGLSLLSLRAQRSNPNSPRKDSGLLRRKGSSQ